MFKFKSIKPYSVIVFSNSKEHTDEDEDQVVQVLDAMRKKIIKNHNNKMEQVN